MVFVPGFFATLISLSHRIAGALAHRRAVQALAEWDARALKDIGLTHGDVEGARALPFYQDPTVLLASLAGRAEVLPSKPEQVFIQQPAQLEPLKLRIAQDALCA